MNWELVEGNWKNFRGTVRARWSKLTDENLDAVAGKRDQLVSMIVSTYGIRKLDAERELQSFEERNKNYRPK
jgi:uncharacterized protein YjbJ (UPF0337 family)